MTLFGFSKKEFTPEDRLAIAAKKDPLVFGQLYDKYYRQILGFIYKRTNNVELAQDLTSETFFQAIKNLWRYQPRGQFSSWLYQIAIAQISNFYRQRKKCFELTLEEAPELIANPIYQPDIVQMETEKQNELEALAGGVHNLLSQLKEKQHTAIVLKYYENKSIKEIAEIMRARESTIKSHLRRGLKNLQKFLDNSYNLINYEQPIKQNSNVASRRVAVKSQL